MKTRKVRRNGKNKTVRNFLFNPRNPDKSFDVYIDKNPKDTINIKYTTLEDVKNTIDKLEKLTLVSFPLAPKLKRLEDAKLLPKTSLVVVKLAPICSTSRLLPPERIIRFFLSIIHLPETPYLNLLSSNPYAV